MHYYITTVLLYSGGLIDKVNVENHLYVTQSAVGGHGWGLRPLLVLINGRLLKASIISYSSGYLHKWKTLSCFRCLFLFGC